GGTRDAQPGESAEEIDLRLAALEKTAVSRIETYFSKTRSLPAELHISPPARFGEVGWQCQGKLVNYDTVAYLERIALLYYAGFLNRQSPISLLDRPNLRILELGGGYGGLAYHIKQLLPSSRYTIVDLPESLAFSSVYLGVLFREEKNRFGAAMAGDPKPGFSLVPNFEFPALVESGAKFDLVINTLSLSEMSVPQIRAYCEGIAALVGQDGFFFEQNQNNHHLGLQFAPEIIREYFYHHLNLGAPPQHHQRVPGGQLPASRGAAAVLEQGFASVWANRPIPALEKDPRAFLPPPTLLTGEYPDHNVLQFGSSYYALPKSAGPVDFFGTDVSAVPGVFCDLSRDAVEAFCRRNGRAAARA
ncbi:MAG TPA: putative sugar O-methyltransferase, partial [Pirellulales bacterium]|nr:putative sugar O-methyltransferase [Pirellulales bacterium]